MPVETAEQMPSQTPFFSVEEKRGDYSEDNEFVKSRKLQ